MLRRGFDATSGILCYGDLMLCRTMVVGGGGPPRCGVHVERTQESGGPALTMLIEVQQRQLVQKNFGIDLFRGLYDFIGRRINMM